MVSTSDIIGALYYLSRLINIFILVRVIFSWVNPNPHSSLVQFIYAVTEPILSPVRQLIYRLGYNGMIDFSPIAAIFLVNMGYSLLARLVIGLW
ncbi:YggT family protein [Clostridium formicaceticum]|uniref:YGGT family protein n=1 Tax=Clostridium formicaceticum TaxID=1497 RepID=A0AAC9RLN2_9CLOT|nr:YggT family protein [Clostridium formicaceticum]AOY77387.1 YggT family protein [Clostridium formicaceticum]ARE87937.1 YGGT family protein [Clostridium formicaceticum]